MRVWEYENMCVWEYENMCVWECGASPMLYGSRLYLMTGER